MVASHTALQRRTGTCSLLGLTKATDRPARERHNRRRAGLPAAHQSEPLLQFFFPNFFINHLRETLIANCERRRLI